MSKFDQYNRIMQIFYQLIDKHDPPYSAMMTNSIKESVYNIIHDEEEQTIPPHDNTLDIIEKYEELTRILIEQIRNTDILFRINNKIP